MTISLSVVFEFIFYFILFFFSVSILQFVYIFLTQTQGERKEERTNGRKKATMIISLKYSIRKKKKEGIEQKKKFTETQEE